MDWSSVWRLAAAGLAGCLLGLHYELRRRPGGLRTHFVTAIGAAVFCMTLVDEGDAGRAVQGVASGVGFIGAAGVLKQRQYVRGITSAASVWTAAALGCVAELGQPLMAVGIAAAVGIVDHALLRLVRKRTQKLHSDQDHPDDVSPADHPASSFQASPEAR